MKIILHVPDKNRIAHALANAGNLLKEEDFDGDIAIVFNGDAAGDVTGRTI